MAWRPDRARRLGPPILALGLLVAACSDDGAGSGDRAVVEVFGNLVGRSGERLGQVLAEVSAGSSVELRYVGVTSFVEQLGDRLDQGDRPGVVLLPQPGLLLDLADRGVLQPLTDDVVELAEENFPPGLLDLVTLDGALAAVWLNLDVKGLVWYRPSLFEEQGLSIPESLDELAALSDAVADTAGISPWCVMIEAGGSTGWVGTDWVENYVLRRLGPDVYDQWIRGEVTFDDERIAGVFEELDALLRRPGALAGGTRAVLTTPWELSAPALVSSPPRCLMVQQADFLRTSFPGGTQFGEGGDVRVFPLPAAEPGAAPPIILGGRLAAPLGDSPEVAEAMALIASDEMAVALQATGEFETANLEVLQSAAQTDPVAARVIEIVQAAPELRFDGSDLMPPAVGTGTFWSGMASFFAREDLDAVLAEIQSGWSQVAGAG